MSLYGEYILEREGYSIVETAAGFATFKVNGVECYLRDLYVKPQFRKDGVAAALADEVQKRAKEMGATILLGSVCVGMLGDTDSLKVLLAYGMKMCGVNGDFIYFNKEIR